MSIGSGAFALSGLTAVTIPGGLKEIKNDTFADCENLVNVTIGEGVKKIGNSAFSTCSALESVTIPGSVTEIESCAFNECSSLVNVNIAEGLERIGEAAFNGCSSIENITIPDSVHWLGSYVFGNCSALNEITIPGGIWDVPEHAFAGCESLESVIFENGVKWIEEWAFEGCDSLKSISLPASIRDIEYEAFSWCDDFTVIYQEGVKEIPENAFYEVWGVTGVTIPSSVTKVGCNAFRETKWWDAQEDGIVVLDGWAMGIKDEYPEDLVIPNGVAGIADEAFYFTEFYEDFAKTITIPDSVKYIGDYAFRNTWVETPSIPAGVVRVGAYAFDETIWWCDHDEGLLIVDGWLLGVKCWDFDEYAEIENLELPSGIKGIAGSALMECVGLKSVTISEGVTTIGDYAFANCPLEEVSLPDGLIDIGNYAFANCPLEEVSLPDGLIDIGNYAFEICPIAEMAIPESVKSIGKCAFVGHKLEKLTIPSGVEYIGDEAFWAGENLEIVTILCASCEIGESAFDACENLKAIIIPSSLADDFYTENEGTVLLVAGADGEYTAELPETAYHEEEAEVVMPEGIDMSKVTVRVVPGIQRIKLNGAQMIVCKWGYDITDLIEIPAPDGDGWTDMSALRVKNEIVREVLDPKKGGSFTVVNGEPVLTTAPTRPGLGYVLREGETLDEMYEYSSYEGNGKQWTPELSVKGGKSGFYSIGVYVGWNWY